MKDSEYRDFVKRLVSEMMSGDVGRRAAESFFKKSDFTFAASKKGPEFADKVYKDGRVVTGKFI
jgi:hypothetical protein